MPTRRASASEYRRAAGARLRRFRQGSLLAVAITGLALLVGGVSAEPGEQPNASVATQTESGATVPAESERPAPTASSEGEAVRGAREARQTVSELATEAYRILPKVGIALLVLIAAALFSRALRALLRRVLAVWERAEAASALSGVAVWLLALGVALSVLAGDARALVGSVGLFGLALSWALQAPIESFTGWLLNSFRGYYRVGDRIAVGEVFGDVYRIDFLTTTVWEAGGPDKAVTAAQPTGAMITFPNSEVLRSNVTNFTYDFAWVWDELATGVANESDLGYATRVVQETAARVVGAAMAEPAREYARLLERAKLHGDVAAEPQVYVSFTDSWTNLTVRYLVPARERRKWSSALALALQQELAKPEHRGRILPSYPVTRVELERQDAGAS